MADQNKGESGKNPDCPCRSTYCKRRGYCEECQKYHHSQGEKTTCGK